jgi:hypothetical protein
VLLRSRSVDAAREVIARGVSGVFTIVNVESLKSHTIKSWCETWLQAKAIETEESSHARYARIIRRLLEFLGAKSDRDLSTLQANDIMRFRDRLSNFRRKRGETVADFFKAEAQTPVTLPWLSDPKTGRVNLTEHMALKRRNPELCELCDRSVATAREWSQEILTQAEKQIAELEAKRAEAAALLQKKVESTLQAK